MNMRDIIYCITLGILGGLFFAAEKNVSLLEGKLTHCMNEGTFRNGNDALKCQGVIYEKGN